MSELSEEEAREVIAAVADLLSDDWKQFARRLGFGIEIINSIDSYNTTRKEKCKAVLRRVLIMDRMGLDYLKKKLRSMGRQDVIDLIEDTGGIFHISF